MISRRSLLKYVALAPAMSAGLPLARATNQGASEKADYTLRIATGLVELSPEHIVSTTLYNGQFPVRSCASRKVGESSSISTTIRIRRNSCIGTDR